MTNLDKIIITKGVQTAAKKSGYVVSDKQQAALVALLATIQGEGVDEFTSGHYHVMAERVLNAINEQL